ncbi:MAG: lytic transglycosylase domain-containing protein [Geobacteraceae bacterium]|nr:lytic transglycosylase domain-containing protein [Geobacteraceae bacterium]
MTSHFKIIGAITLLLLIFSSTGYPFCFQEAGQLYGINPLVLRSIAKVESNTKPDTIHENSNGTFDVGLMQINTIWKMTLGEERWRFLGDACYNTKTGAWILASCISKYGYNWKAIGCYNSQTPEKSEMYAKRVFSQLERLKSGRDPQPLDNDVETAMLSEVDALVKAAVQGKSTPKTKVLKFAPYTRLSRDKLLTPPPPPPGEPSAPVPLAW